MNTETGQRYNAKPKKQAQPQKKLCFQKNKIKVPTYVLDLYATNKNLFKALSVYYALKALQTNGVIFNIFGNETGPNHRREVATLLKLSKTTLDTRIDYLLKYKLADQVGSSLHLCSNPKAHEIATLITKKRHNLYYVDIKILPEMPFWEVLKAHAEKRLYKKKCKCLQEAVMVYDNVKAPEAAMLIEQKKLSIISTFIYGGNVKPVSPYQNPFTDLSQAEIAKLFGYNSNSSAYYWRSKMLKRGLIELTNFSIKGESTDRKQTSVYGKVYYSRKEGANVLQMRNKTTYLL